MRNRALVLSLLSFAVSVPAFALPGEAAAVLQQCGVPAGQEQTTSPVTGRLELNYLYNDLTLHFQPMGGGWSFTTAWHNHMPILREDLENRLPCFKTAMQQAASQPLPNIDPTIAAQTAIAPVDESTFGVPHLWLIVVLVLGVVIFALMPARRRRVVDPLDSLRKRYLRRPALKNITTVAPRKHVTQI